MWLLNAHRQELQFFEGQDVPPYAILSHRWEDEEMTMQELRNGTGRSKPGYQKIDRFCHFVADTAHSVPKPASAESSSDGERLSWVWVDTCCIDKTSSAELSEAINSMYQWYENAVICYVYLSDVHKAQPSELVTSKLITQSLWFTRGWTLQELIAPRNLVFLNGEWKVLGTKEMFCKDIVSATGITEAVMLNKQQASKVPAAAVMSWAAPRRTSREEDRAYSLFGLLGVNLPLLYGEGKRAFHRLQEALLTSTDDLTILAWDTISDPFCPPNSIFASSPSDYSKLFGKLKPINESWERPSSRPMSLSGQGLSICIRCVPVSYHVYQVPLAYSRKEGKYTLDWSMLIQRHEDGLFRRLCARKSRTLFELDEFEHEWEYMLMDITLARDSLEDWEDMRLSPSFFAATIEAPRRSWDHYRSDSVDERHEPDSRPLRHYGVSDIIALRRSGGQMKYFVLGLDFDFVPFCLYIRLHPSDARIRNPRDVLFRSESNPGRLLSLGSQRDVMRLVAVLQDRIGLLRGCRKDDNIELFTMPKSELAVQLAANEFTFRSVDRWDITLRMNLERMESMVLDLSVHIERSGKSDPLPGRKHIDSWQIVGENQPMSRAHRHIQLGDS